jgi:L-rhamnose mutarotase
MKRIGQMIRLKPGVEEAYKAIHVRIWPEIEAAIRDGNIRNYNIFLKDGILFAYFEYHGPDDQFEADMARIAAAPRMEEWWAITKGMQEPLETRGEGEWWANMEQVFFQE